MRKIQSRVVSRLVVLLGIRWSSSLHRGQVGPIVQNIVVQGALAGVSTDAKYRELKAASVKGDFHFLQQIQQTQNKTAKQHRDKIQEIITALFEDTTDPMVNDIKKDLFDVPRGGSIVPREHRVMAREFVISRKTTVISRGTRMSRIPSVPLSEPTHLLAQWVLVPQRFVSGLTHVQ